MNQRLLLDRLFVSGPATRPQLARIAGLSLPTVGAALEDLERGGLVRQTGRPTPPQGRPAIVYEANPEAGTVVGVDIGRSWLHVLVTDLAGVHLARIDARNSARSAPALVNLISKLVTAVVEKAGLTERPTHTVIGSPGVLDPSRGRVLYAANLPGWHRLGLADALMARLGDSLTIDNDANLAALAEHAYGAARNVRDFVYLKVGTGVGVGLVLAGRVYRGFRGAAGEVGYLPIGVEVAPERSRQPSRGMMEDVLAADAVVAHARTAGMTGRLTAQAVFAAARAGDVRAIAAVEMEADWLSSLLASICAFLDPELIVLGGGVGQNLELMRSRVDVRLSQLTPLRPNLILSTTGEDAVVLGAIARGVEIARQVVFQSHIERASVHPLTAADQ